MTKILFIDCDDDFSTMHFEENFPDMERVVRELNVEGVTDGVTLTFDDEASMRYTVTLRVLEFDAVDEDFIAWIMGTFVDYDLTKARNFHVLKEDDE